MTPLLEPQEIMALRGKLTQLPELTVRPRLKKRLDWGLRSVFAGVFVLAPRSGSIHLHQ